MLPIDFLVTTIKRPNCIERLLDSLQKFYPNAKVTVADQNKEPHWDIYENYDINVLDLPYDCGLSKARNEMLKVTSEPYVLILDDDFVFDKRTRIGKLLKIIKTDPKIGVVGGQTERRGSGWGFTHEWEIDDDTIRQVDDGDNWQEIKGIKCKETASVINFALMRREMFNDVKWDNRLKLVEHSDFYLQLRETDWKVYYVPEVICQTIKSRDRDYLRMRRRKKFFKTFFKKWGVKRMINTSGRVKEWDFEKDKLKTYRVK